MNATCRDSKLDKDLCDLMTLSRDIVSEKYLNDILQLVVTVTAHAAEIDVCLLWLQDDNDSGKRLRLKAWHGIDSKRLKVFPTDQCERMAERVLAENEPLIVSNFLFSSMIGLPLRGADGAPIGVLLCFSHWAHLFTPKLIERMSGVAKKAASVILGTELLVTARVAQEELETLTLLEKTRNFLVARQGIGVEEAGALILNYSTESISSPRRAAETILLSDFG